MKRCVIWVCWAQLGPKSAIVATTVGRIIFNRSLPEELWFVNELLDKKGVNEVVERVLQAPWSRSDG